MSSSEINASAYHEAGHAVMAWCLGNPVIEPGVRIDRAGSGHCSSERRVPQGELMPAWRRGYDLVWQQTLQAAQFDIAEYQAGGAAERRYLALGDLPEAELRRTLAAALRYRPGVDTPRDALIVLRILAEIRLAETGRFVSGFEVWGAHDTAAVTDAYRAVERGVSVTLRERRIWQAVEQMAEALLCFDSLTAAEANELIAAVAPPRLDQSQLLVQLQ